MREVLYFLVCAVLARLQVKYCPYYGPYHILPHFVKVSLVL